MKPQIETAFDYPELARLDLKYDGRLWREGVLSIEFVESQTGSRWVDNIWIILFIITENDVTTYILEETDLRGEEGRKILSQILGYE